MQTIDMEKPQDIIAQRKQKALGLRQTNVNLFPNDFKPLHTIEDIKDAIGDSPESVSEDGPVYAVAGRMIAINRFGKTAFIRFRDRTGQLQAYIRKDRVGEEGYRIFRQLDIGDCVGLRGGVFQTKTGEWTLLVKELVLVCKSYRPLPEKFHGLKDPEKRYRQRYVDLIMNGDVRETFRKRSRIIETLRTFLIDREFLEVETPMMQPLPGGAEATPFVTHHNALGMDLYLRIAPELYLKRLVIGGFERVFEINRSFRNEGISTRHNPEFTMLEFYQAYATYQDLMDMTEELFSKVTRRVTGSNVIDYQGHQIDMSEGWQRITMSHALETIGGVDPKLLRDREALAGIADAHGIDLPDTGHLGKAAMKLFDSLVEPKLIQPTFVTGYPVEVSPLSRRSETDPSLTERFELFIAGREIANGFSELNDPEDQEARFAQQVADRNAGDKEAHHMDRDYIEALEYGLPPCAGEGIGIDRLVMLLTDSASIREVILFPHMKPVAKM